MSTLNQKRTKNWKLKIVLSLGSGKKSDDVLDLYDNFY